MEPHAQPVFGNVLTRQVSADFEHLGEKTARYFRGAFADFAVELFCFLYDEDFKIRKTAF